MQKSHLQVISPLARVPQTAPAPRPLGRVLVEQGAITPEQLVKALHLQLSLNAPLGEVLIAEGWTTAPVILGALADQHQTDIAALDNDPPDPKLGAARPASFWLAHQALPWKQRPGEPVEIAIARPDRFDSIRAEMTKLFGPVPPVLASKLGIARAISRQFGDPLAQAAETRVPAALSCRGWTIGQRLILPGIVALGVAGLVAFPAAALVVLCLFATLTVMMFITLKICAFTAELSARPVPTPGPAPAPAQAGLRIRRPKVSVLVPLYRETEVVQALIARLLRLTYPKALLDVVLVLEARDDLTRRTLAQTQLPSWIRIIEVPDRGRLTTKPRAMNYALDFCEGEFIGIWDAEDAPAADQIEQVIAHFATAPREVVCVQGVLDYYNPRTNWLARCFTIEYAAWFRVVLPGLARLGLVVPLGGTTLFVRRDALVALGGWDAHNVTEDADLGVRISRMGYRTEMVTSTTYEEANCHLWPWIKQRSRWLKGFMVTYLVHMRAPGQLLRDLGLRQFLSFQAFFLGTICQFLLAPALWSLWLVLLGVDHPILQLAPPWVFLGLGIFFLMSELLAIYIGGVAVTRAGRRSLIPWIPTQLLYFPLGTIAAYKALCELVLAPYYWEKTTHGVVSP